ncbi:hypothetical protein [Helicobacter sp. 23-1045]
MWCKLQSSRTTCEIIVRFYARFVVESSVYFLAILRFAVDSPKNITKILGFG